ncbi:MAG: ExeM/NucH family extracellular endonuclease [Acidimicrobiia bacterium]|nr:ExeM/NucH family extracellular endonuclease [Acidimicrobiia bacterium]
MRRRKTRSSLAVVTVLAMLMALLPVVALPVAAATTGDIVISGVVDGPLTGGIPKAIELYVVNDIDDLSIYGVGSANNGGGTDGEEFTFPAVSALAGTYLYVASESVGFTDFFGFAPDYTSAAANVNGDDAIELFMNGIVVDVFGDINVDGSGQPWEYLDGWAYRVADTGQDGSTFVLANWTFSDPNALDGETSNATATTPFPLGTFGGVVVPTPALIINEVDADQVGTDAGEFVELFDGGFGATTLDGHSIVLYNGSDDVSYLSFDLDGYTTNADGYFVLCGNTANVAGCDLDVSPDTDLIQNGPDAVALVEGDAVNYPNDTPVTADGLIDAIVYDTDDGDDAGLLVLLNAGQPQVNERGGGDGTAHSNQRCPNGSGGALNTDTYAQYLPTPGATNTCVAPTLDLTIVEIQTPVVGTGSPFEGDRVRTQGVVTAVLGDYVFIQDGTGPYSGLMLFRPTEAVELGDLVLAEGVVSEYFGLTEIAGAVVTVLGTGNPIPAPEVLATGAVGDEAWESVFVRAENATVTDDDLGFGEWIIDDSSGPVVVDDLGSYTYDPTNGDVLTYVQGPLFFSFGDFKIEPRSLTDIGLDSCSAPFTPIFAIQGSGAASSYDGTDVWTEGVVTADFQASSQLSAFYIQDPVGDADSATSDGVMVYHRDTWGYDVNVGDHVRVLAEVDEFNGLTELTSVDNVIDCGTGSVAPTEVVLPVVDPGAWESYEGMLITFPQSLSISEFFNFDRFGEMVLSNGRQFQPTQIFEPGSSEATDLLAENLRNRITLDDGRGSQNPDPAIHPNGAIFDLTNRFRGGDHVTNVTGVLDYSFGNYKIQPTQGADYDAINPRADAPDVGEASIKVASFNVLNLFTHLDDGVNDICGPTGLDECRGADTAEEYERQLTKIVAGIIGTGADVLGLQEIENDIRDDEPVYPNRAHDPVLALVEALNAVEGDGTWAWAGEATYYNDYPVRNEIIYRTESVTPIGTPVALEDPAFDVSASGDDPVGRPPLAQTFADGNGEVFTVVTNHFKSKGSSCGSLGDPDTGDGSGNCNLTRVAQSEALLLFVADLPAATQDNDVLIIGDLNSYAKEAPVSALEDAGYTNLLALYDGPEEYTYVFDGQLGNLDHALGSSSVLSQVTGTAAWHINSDEPDILDYDTSFKKDAQVLLYEPNAYRASDHDPVIVGLDLTAASDFVVEVAPNRLWPPNHEYREVVVSGTDAEADLWIEILEAVSSELDCCYDMYDLPSDVVITSDTTVDLRAERYTEVLGRTYTITAYAWDGAGNALLTDVFVSVPHDQRNKKVSKN